MLNGLNFDLDNKAILKKLDIKPSFKGGIAIISLKSIFYVVNEKGNSLFSSGSTSIKNVINWGNGTFTVVKKAGKSEAVLNSNDLNLLSKEDLEKTKFDLQNKKSLYSFELYKYDQKEKKVSKIREWSSFCYDNAIKNGEYGWQEVTDDTVIINSVDGYYLYNLYSNKPISEKYDIVIPTKDKFYVYKKLSLDGETLQAFALINNEGKYISEVKAFGKNKNLKATSFAALIYEQSKTLTK